MCSQSAAILTFLYGTRASFHPIPSSVRARNHKKSINQSKKMYAYSSFSCISFPVPPSPTGEMYSLLAAILTSRSWDDITSPDLGSLRAPRTQEDKTLIRSYAQRYYFEIVEILNSVPREMLLLLKMNDCLRHIDRELGAPVNSSLVTAEEAVKALLREELKAGAREGGRAGWGRKVWAWWDYVRCEARIKTYLAWLWAGSRVKRLPLLKGGENGKEEETETGGALA